MPSNANNKIILFFFLWKDYILQLCTSMKTEKGPRRGRTTGNWFTNSITPKQDPVECSHWKQRHPLVRVFEVPHPYQADLKKYISAATTGIKGGQASKGRPCGQICLSFQSTGSLKPMYSPCGSGNSRLMAKTTQARMTTRTLAAQVSPAPIDKASVGQVSALTDILFSWVLLGLVGVILFNYSIKMIFLLHLDLFLCISDMICQHFTVFPENNIQKWPSLTNLTRLGPGVVALSRFFLSRIMCGLSATFSHF